eukprot:3552959-Prymnesium_polylepis.1
MVSALELRLPAHPRTQPPSHVPTPLTFPRTTAQMLREAHGLHTFTGRRTRAAGDLLEQRNRPIERAAQMSE